ncbi:MAG: HU family DNA-binding protein [Propionivibrio sp.]|uniref:HU family DNA-binding protein n=1 Tax=Candidatus Propionivibrio dominans TaxID=2954373 RepID=A0A9D7I869_9RHOO|nr:HU family DNA-binding protein [Candidatus Propionivibrio dominans]MBL0168488.1 HU family DNA-binding protein [Propionivibrio sp.]
MIRSDPNVALAIRFPKSLASDAGIAVKEVLVAIAHSMARGERVEVGSFVRFSVNCRASRAGRHSITGEKVSVPAKYVPSCMTDNDVWEFFSQPVMPVRIKQAA